MGCALVRSPASVVTTLLDDRYAPITSSIGFLKMPVEDAAEALAAWRRSLAPPVSIEPLDHSLEDALRQLDPLELGNRSRELLVAVDGGWTAYFDCLVSGTDAVTAMGFLAQTNQCDAASITSIAGSKGRGGSIRFEIYGPQPTEWLNHVRAIQVAEDDGRWRFFEAGQPQPFEDLDAYRARRIRDRLTTDMLSKYCEALGFRPFEVSAYREAVLVRSNRPDDIVLISLEDVQRRLELTPSPPAMLNRPDVPGGRALRWTRAASRWLRGSRANPDR